MVLAAVQLHTSTSGMRVLPPFILIGCLALLGIGIALAAPDAAPARSAPLPYTLLDTVGVPRIRLPLGNVQVSKYRFPETWEYNRRTGKVEPEDGHPAGMDSVLRGLPKAFNRLYQSDSRIIAQIRPDSSLIDPFLLRPDYYKVDLRIGPIGYCTFDSTVVVLFKDAGTFQPLLGEPDISVVQYIYFVAYRNGRLSDQLLTYYEDISAYEKMSRYFYLNKKGQLYIREFYFGELECGATGVSEFQVSAAGTFDALR